MTKKIFTFILALFAIATTAGAQNVAISDGNFPDENFRAYVTEKFDTDKNNFLSEEEIAKVTKIDVNGKGINSLKGIAHFTALTELRCHNNGLTELGLSTNKKLTYLRCYRNKIKGTEMKMLVASLPRVTGGQFYVINLDGDSNEQNEIVVPAVNNAKDKGWKVLGYSGGTTGEWKEYAGSGIEINNNNFLDYFFQYAVRQNIDTDHDGYLNMEEIANVENLDVRKRNIAHLKGIEYFTALKILDCAENKLKMLEMPKNTELKSLYCQNNNLERLLVGKNAKLEHLECQNNNLDGLVVRDNTALTYLDCSFNRMSSLVMKDINALKRLDCHENQLLALDVSKHTALTYLSCSANKLTALDVSNNTALKSLYCYSNRIKGDNMQALVESLPKVTGSTLVVINTKDSNEGNVITKSQVALAKSKGWKVVDYNGGIGIDYEGSDPEGIKIDATNFPDANFRSYLLAQSYGKDAILTDAEIAAVKKINVYNQNIANLKGIEYFTELETLRCYGNQLKSLDVSKNTKLTDLNCHLNQISGDKMQALVESLPTVTNGTFSVFKLDDEKEKNVITKSQVDIAKSKGWKVWAFDGSAWSEYAGSDDTTAIDASLNDNGKMTNDSWYTIDGVKLQGEPTKKGVYIYKGKKVKR